MECSSHIQCAAPAPEQRIECLMDRINCTDSTLQAAIGLIRASTRKNLEDFETVSNSLIKVDPYCRSSCSASRNSDVFSNDFKHVRGTSGIDLRWNSREEFQSSLKIKETICRTGQEGMKARRRIN